MAFFSTFIVLFIKMTISVYDITIPVYIRALKNVSHLLTKVRGFPSHRNLELPMDCRGYPS